jgi:hypothetical protein
LKFTAFELGEGALEIYKDTLSTFENFAHMPLARRGRRAGGDAGQIPARGRQGVEEGVVSEHQEVKAHLLEVLGREEDGRKGCPYGGRDGGERVLGGEGIPGEEEDQAWA